MFSYKSEFFKSKGLFRLDQLYIERWGNIIVTEVSLGFKSCLNVMPVFFIFHVFFFFLQIACACVWKDYPVSYLLLNNPR